MEKRNSLKCFVFGLVALAGIAVLVPNIRRTIVFDKTFGSLQSAYTLSLTSKNSPSSSDMEHHTVYTANGNPIDVTYTNCEASSEKHVKINAGGEIVINTKLTGVYSGNAIYDGTLKIWCGLEPDQMWEANISETLNEFFSTYKFNYVKLVAETDVVLESVNLLYSCSDVGSQKATIRSIDVASGTVVNYSNLEYEMGSTLYLGAKGLGTNNVTVKLNGNEVNKSSSGAYEFNLGPEDQVEVLSDYNLSNGVTVNCYKTDGTLLDTQNVKFSTHDAFSGTIYAPVMEGYVANTPVRKMLLDNSHQSVDIYYSELSQAWDGTTVSDSFTGDGSEANPYLIESGADLKLLADTINSSTDLFANKFFKMTKSIDLGNNAISIGTSTTVGFNGTFDGNNCTINNFKSSNGLFFSLLAKGTIKNLSLDGEVNNTKGNTVTRSSPFVVNAVSGSKITNCFNYATLTVTSTSNPGTGGHASFVGTGCANISNCENYADVLNKSTKRYYAGGIVGLPTGTATIENTINWGAVLGGTGTGGLLGVASANSVYTISNCQNFGEVKAIYPTANYISGGLVGAALGSSTLKIENSQNYGHVIGVNYSNSIRATQFGGILGATFGAAATLVEIKNSDNYGEVEADYIVGGIYGGSSANATPITVDNCNNYGYVHSNGHNQDNTIGYVGGIAGWARSTNSDIIKNCVNWGEVEAKSAKVTIGDKTANGGSGSAGICSYNGGSSNVTITSCKNFGYIHCPTSGSGGIMAGTSAASSASSISDCINYGTIESISNVGGIIGVIYFGSVSNCLNKGLLIGNKTTTGDIIGTDSRK